MQLFVIPLLIVSLIVGIWLLFHWIADRGTRPDEIAAEIERLDHGSWQKALTLANQLRDDRNSGLRGDKKLCQRLSDQLDARVEENGQDQERRFLRIYLCRALGDFDISDGIPALVRTVNHQETADDLTVRRAALQAIGMLVNRIGMPDDRRPILDAVTNAAQAKPKDDKNQVDYVRLRSTAAFVLGVLPDGDAVAPLVALLDDPAEDVRFNAAVALARHGDERCLETLQSMLAGVVTDEAAPDARLKQEEVKAWPNQKRQLVVSTALGAAKRFRKANPQADFTALQNSIRAVADLPDMAPSVLEEARAILNESGNTASD